METSHASMTVLEGDGPSGPGDDDIDVNRLVWDTEYRRRIVERLRRERAANDNPSDPANRAPSR